MKYLITITFLFNFQSIIYNHQSAIAQAPSLSCVSVNINGDVQLNWTPPSDTCGIFNSYDIYAASSLSGPYILITSISNFGQTTYSDIAAAPGTNVVYYYIVNNSGCVSNISDTIQADKVAPGTVTIETVSVDSLTSLATISWIPSTLFDVDGYIIYIANEFGGWDSIATVFGRDSTFFIYPNSNAGAESESYNIVAIDQCGNTGLIGTEHNTIYLSTSLDTCEVESTLEWNEYINWPSGVAEYNIYVSENGAPGSLLGTTTNTQFIHTGLVKTTTYCYMIRAIGSGLKTSSSNIICGFTDTTACDTSITGLPKEARGLNVHILPNPTTDQFTLEMDLEKNTMVSIKLYQITGQQIFAEEVKHITGAFSKQIDLSNYAKGIYYVQVVTGNSVFTRKVIYQ